MRYTVTLSKILEFFRWRDLIPFAFLLGAVGCSFVLSPGPPPRISAAVGAGASPGELQAVPAPEYRIRMTSAVAAVEYWSEGIVNVEKPGAEAEELRIAAGETLARLLARLGYDTGNHPEVVGIVRDGARGAEPPNPTYIICDTRRLLRYGDLRQDLALLPGDLVFVPFLRSTLRADFYASFGVLVEW
ncbi:MAG: hypothetical protein L0Z55_12565 [Planctomycetes bacterium]|nr:hypothetical protein [Planctomycetota bacterium]